MDKLRIDKWLWAARFYKTRTLAVEDIHKGRIHVNEQEAKPAREVHAGDTVVLRQAGLDRTLVVKAVSDLAGIGITAGEHMTGARSRTPGVNAGARRWIPERRCGCQ